MAATTGVNFFVNIYTNPFVGRKRTKTGYKISIMNGYYSKTYFFYLFCRFWIFNFILKKPDNLLKYSKKGQRICSLIKFKTDSIIIQAIDGISKLIGLWLTKPMFDRCFYLGSAAQCRNLQQKHVLKETWFLSLHILYANGTRHLSIFLGKVL